MKGLFLRWVFVILGVTVLAVGTFQAFFMMAMSRRFAEAEPGPARLSAVMVQDGLATLTPADGQAWLDSIGQQMNAEMTVLDTAGIDLEDRALQALAEGETVMHMGGPRELLYIPVEGDRTVLATFDKKADMRPRSRDMVLPFAALLVISFLGTAVLVLPISRRLNRLGDATQAIGGGRLDTRVKVGGGDAIGQLEGHFNAMAERVQSLLDRQRQLIQAVAHEIRTPIARIRWAQETVSSAADDEQRNKRLGMVDDQLEELDELVSELLVFSRYEEGVPKQQHKEIAVLEVAQQVIERHETQHPNTTIDLQGDDLLVHAHPRGFERVLRNLVSNAVRHSRSRVEVRIFEEDAAVVVQVSDDGKGVPADERERIFEPFTRVDRSRNRFSGGVGLGLAIVRRILEAHGGSAEVGDAEIGGARFTTRWPATRR